MGAVREVQRDALVCTFSTLASKRMQEGSFVESASVLPDRSQMLPRSILERAHV